MSQVQVCPRTFAALLCASSCLASAAWADDELFGPPPVYAAIDANGVNVTNATYNVTVTDLSIGPAGSGGLPYIRSFIGSGWRDNFIGTITHTNTIYTVSIGAFSEEFDLQGGVYVPVQIRGSTLTFDSSAQQFTYTRRDGAKAIFAKNNDPSNYDAKDGGITSFTTPTGEKQYYEYQSVRICPDSGCPVEPYVTVRRLKSVSNNRGYKIYFSYAGNTGGGPLFQSNFPAWTQLSKAVAFNQGIEICGTTTNPDLCPLTGSWPRSLYANSGSTLTVTDPENRATTYTYNAAGQITRVHRPASVGSTNDTVIGYVNDKVKTVSNGVGTWQYNIGSFGSLVQAVVTDPNGNTRTTLTNPQGQIMRAYRGAETPTQYDYYSNGLLHVVTFPSGQTSTYTYDGRGNITNITAAPSTGGGTLSVTAAYDASCTNPVTCNRPNSTTDASGFRTNYTYDPTYGVVTSITLPAPSGAAPIGVGTRPQVRPSYSLKTAKYLVNVGGTPTMTPSPDQIYVESGYSVCSVGTAPGCVGGANETTELIGYGAVAPTNYNNLLPSIATTAAGDGSLSAGTRFTFDEIGNLVAIDPPGGITDPTYYRYNANRELTGIIYPGPNPGSTKYRATTFDYNDDGLQTKKSLGTVNTAQGWGSFSAKSVLTTTYDGIDRVTKESLSVDGVVQSITQFDYDNANRRTCTAVRLKLTSVPASACTSATVDSPDGPDRIQKFSYNALDQVTAITQALHEPDERTYAGYTYLYGQPFELTDAKGNKTTYEYDGYGRLKKVRFPDPTATGTSSTTDYLQFGYDANSRLESLRLRNAQSVTYEYYNTGWFKKQQTPGGVNDTTFNYDLFGRRTSAQGSSQTISFDYDALSRLTAQTSTELGALSYEYDIAGRRTKMTWPDGVFVTYDIDPIGEVTAIRESGAASGPRVLAQFTYDDLGRRLTLTRGNGANTTYHYTGAWLDSLTQSVAAPDAQTITLGHNAAGQISSRTNTNNSYVYSASNGTDTYTSNGLNQIKKKNGVTFTYDDNGNLTFDASNNYVYDALNHLTSVSGAHTSTLTYDPLGRLYRTTGAVTRRFLYDGSNVVAEFDGGGTITDRYVHGPGVDEPLTWYIGSAVTNRNWFVADERGSISSVTDHNGIATALNKYDPYGQPAASNVGRFQFTGQVYLPDAGVYYYKARTYLPSVGRFMQTNPVGVAGGMNLYAYAGNDPLNFTDPMGLDCLGLGGANTHCDSADDNTVDEFVVTGSKPPSWDIIEPPHIDVPDTWPGGLAIPSLDQLDSSTEQQETCELTSPTGNFTTARGVVPLFNTDTANLLSSALSNLNSQGIVPVMTSGYRSPELQAALRAGNNPNVITPARVSWHEAGGAVDFGPNSNAGNNDAIQAAMTAQGFTWGGNFRTPDRPHFQNHPPGTRPSDALVSACSVAAGG